MSAHDALGIADVGHHEVQRRRREIELRLSATNGGSNLPFCPLQTDVRSNAQILVTYHADLSSAQCAAKEDSKSRQK